MAGSMLLGYTNTTHKYAINSPNLQLPWPNRMDTIHALQKPHSNWINMNSQAYDHIHNAVHMHYTSVADSAYETRSSYF